MTYKIKQLLFIIVIGIISLYYWNERSKELSNSIVFNNLSIQVNINIKSIIYREKKEILGINNSIKTSNYEISYIFPDKLRIENLEDKKTIEIYNGNKFILYDGKIKVKECFPIEGPNVIETEKKIRDIIKNKNYEFFGYEVKDNRLLKVIGVKWELDNHNYMQKFWIGDINEITLPFIEEYFVDNVVISRTTYSYVKVNEAINYTLFEIASLPSSDIIIDGVLSKTVESYDEAQKYLNFNIILPKKLPTGIIPWEIGIVPPVKSPSFYCIYFDRGYRIYLNESKGILNLSPNGKIGDIPCRVDLKNETATIQWEQNDVLIILNGDVKIIDQLFKMAESMAEGNLIRYEHTN
ncbi:hypothetical protein FDN13_04440 [Caloramator sp. E03]|uniref:hypothetical protein n=1 Tax=Caloramator sp. E03 TaxID=2576307 RepID=UPI001110B99B|nr:hypothetical protein [Caloramator sp. E03]QCX33019.1 hypothetical protein FDN13_04440 [Caloramator sp. E03]